MHVENTHKNMQLRRQKHAYGNHRSEWQTWPAAKPEHGVYLNTLKIWVRVSVCNGRLSYTDWQIFTEFLE